MSGDENWLDEIESSATDCVAHNGAWGALEFETGGGQGPCDIEGGDLKNASKSSPRSPNGLSFITQCKCWLTRCQNFFCIPGQPKKRNA